MNVEFKIILEWMYNLTFQPVYYFEEKGCTVWNVNFSNGICCKLYVEVTVVKKRELNKAVHSDECQH